MLRAIATIVLASAAGGCLASSGDEGMVVLNNTAIIGTTCSLLGTSGQAFQTQGSISALSNSPYILTPFLQSKVTASMDQELQRTIILQGAKIDLTVAAVSGTTAAITLPKTHFTSLFAGDLPPGGSANVAFDLVPVDDIAAVKAAAASPADTIDATIQANIVIYGTLGGAEIDANPFQYPVTVCTNCIANLLGGCPQPQGTTVRLGNPCNPFQDGVVDCCQSVGGPLTCPATVASM